MVVAIVGYCYRLHGTTSFMPEGQGHVGRNSETGEDLELCGAVQAPLDAFASSSALICVGAGQLLMAPSL